MISPEELECGAFSKRSCCCHPGPHMGAVPMLRESQAGQDFSVCRDLPAGKGATAFSSAWKAGVYLMKSLIVAPCFFLSMKSSGFV